MQCKTMLKDIRKSCIVNKLKSFETTLWPFQDSTRVLTRDLHFPPENQRGNAMHTTSVIGEKASKADV